MSLLPTLNFRQIDTSRDPRLPNNDYSTTTAYPVPQPEQPVPSAGGTVTQTYVKPLQYRRYAVVSKKELDDKMPGNQGSALQSIGQLGGLGASLGSIAGPVGTAVGTVAGAIGGVFHSIFGHTDHRASFLPVFRTVFKQAISKSFPATISESNGYTLLTKKLTQVQGDAIINEVKNAYANGVWGIDGMTGKYADSMNRVMDSFRITDNPSSNDYILFAYDVAQNNSIVQQNNVTSTETITSKNPNGIIEKAGISIVAIILIFLIIKGK